MMRKHLYLITEHENEEWVGNVNIMNSRLTRVVKNEEGPIQTFDKETGEFDTVGRQVGLGYVDFDSEEDFEDNISEAIRFKLAGVDYSHLEKAGVTEVLEDD